MKRMKKGQGIAWLAILTICIVLFATLAAMILKSTVAGDEEMDIRLGLDLAGGVSITYQVVGDTPTSEELQDTINKLQKRIESELGSDSTTEASVYAVGDDRITVEIPGVTDANAILEELGNPGTIYFISETDTDGNSNYTYYSGYGYFLNYDIDTLIENGSVVLTGTDIKSASAGYQTDSTTGASEPVVSLTLTDEGTALFAIATTLAYANGESIAIYYDGEFVSVPTVNAAITDGSAIISGMDSYDDAAQLASYIRIGGLTLELEELQSEVVGAQLGSNALETSLVAGGIGLLLVMLFLICMYLLPGVIASLALALYTGLMIFVLWAFDVTLTLPGIAGMVLSIGMAVDANVIIFARIREEIAAGKSVAASIDEGFKKAMSAIIDGNITTLIAAAVLGVIGTGTVKGFAITLAIGVVLSMFTALVITRILINAFYGIGLRDAKLYGRKLRTDGKKIDFVGKKAIFFGVSLAVIAAGLIAMGVQNGLGNNALNFSLEFLGGTSTTVDFEEAYTLDEVESEIIPLITEAIDSTDIQTQLVDGSNQIIFKTQTLDLEQREALNAVLEENFGVEESSITSTSIGSTISSEMRSQSILAVIVAAFCMLIYIWFRFKDIRFAGSAIIALIHDVLVVLALYALARISVGSAFIACMLTVIGYSVNDTIVIFDRIRENKKKLRDETPETLKELANLSLNQTLSRSISTSITTAITVLMLLILGVESIREFALPLLAGVICGTYSSIFIATELWYVMKVKLVKKVK